MAREACRRSKFMPLRETEAIVFRTYRLGEADKIVSLFSRQFGRIRAVAAGAQRPKSRYGGLLEPLSYIRLWLFERENRDLLRINSVELLETFFGMQRDFRVQLAAQYLSEAGQSLLPEREVNERAFRLYLAVLRGLKATGEIDRPLLYFDYWLLRLSGFLPSLGECTVCGRALAGQPVSYNRTSVGFSCAACRPAGSCGRLPAESVDLLTRIGRLPLDKWLDLEKPPQSAADLRHALEAWVEASAEKKLLTLEMLSAEA